MILFHKIMKNTSVSNLNLTRSAILYLDGHIIFMISLREIMKMMCLTKHNSARSAVKRLFMALRAKLYLDGDIFFMILLRKIMKKMSPSKESFAAEGGKRLFTQPRTLCCFIRFASLRLAVTVQFSKKEGAQVLP